MLIHEAPSPHDEARPDARTGEVRSHSRGALVARRMARNPETVAGLLLLAVLTVLALAGPALYPWDYGQKDFTAFLRPPSAEHWFGTTQIGSDVFALSLRGMQKSLLIGLLVAVVSTVLAAAVGACAGYFGGWADRLLMWQVDLLLVLPGFLIIAILSPKLRERGFLILVGLLAIFGWMITARVVRGLTISLREREFVQAARYMGIPAPLIVLRHVIPHLASFLIIDGAISVSGAIIAEAGLSFFGFGVQPPDVSLGTVIAAGASEAVPHPWLFAFPAGLLILIVLAVNLVGDGLRDALDPASARGAR
ncbi:ABC transporter permease [Planotetraspora sp. GP83]|uniref:ABC transporter permease n=1 Tax=Planotetraspora sp. GP83 TaxID=3156264 RepID=UPI00351805E4